MGITVSTAIKVMAGKANALHPVTVDGKDTFHRYDNILSARFLARKTTEEAAMFTPSEMRNNNMPMKNST